MANNHPAAAASDDGELDALKKEITALKDGLSRVSQLLLDRGGDSAADAGRHLVDAGQRALTNIRTRPLLAVVIAFLIGLVFGRLVLRK